MGLLWHWKFPQISEISTSQQNSSFFSLLATTLRQGVFRQYSVLSDISLSSDRIVLFGGTAVDRESHCDKVIGAFQFLW